MGVQTDYFKYKNTKEACKAAVRHYGNRCIFTGVNKQDMIVVGAHLWPASTYPEIKKYRQNIIPILWELHTGADNTFDWVTYNKVQREPVERLRVALQGISGKHGGIKEEFQGQFMEQMRELLEIMQAVGLDREVYKIIEVWK